MPSSPIPTIDNHRRGAAVSRARESPNAMRRILILGGTTAARRLADRPRKRGGGAESAPLGGRPTARAAYAVPAGVGGFGGAKGLSQYPPAERADALVDAPHPYAAIISAYAADAAAA